MKMRCVFVLLLTAVLLGSPSDAAPLVEVTGGNPDPTTVTVGREFSFEVIEVPTIPFIIAVVVKGGVGSAPPDIEGLSGTLTLTHVESGSVSATHGLQVDYDNNSIDPEDLILYFTFPAALTVEIGDRFTVSVGTSTTAGASFPPVLDLEGRALILTDGLGWLVSPAPIMDEPIMEDPVTTAAARPDLLIGKSWRALQGGGILERRAASRRQTIMHRRQIFQANVSSAHLRIENEGGTAAPMRLRSLGDRLPRMSVSARVAGQGTNVAAALRSGRFAPVVRPGQSLRVIYRLSTDRFYAGVLRGGDRNDTVRFRLSGGGTSDNAAMVNVYR